MGKFCPPVAAYFCQIEMFKGAIGGSLKGHDQRHELAHAEPDRSAAMPTRSRQQAFLSDRGKGLVEVVEIAKQGYKVHRRAPERKWLGNHRVDHLTLSCQEPCLGRTHVCLVDCSTARSLGIHFPAMRDLPFSCLDC